MSNGLEVESYTFQPKTISDSIIISRFEMTTYWSQDVAQTTGTSESTVMSQNTLSKTFSRVSSDVNLAAGLLTPTGELNNSVVTNAFEYSAEDGTFSKTFLKTQDYMRIRYVGCPIESKSWTTACKIEVLEVSGSVDLGICFGNLSTGSLKSSYTNISEMGTYYVNVETMLEVSEDLVTTTGIGAFGAAEETVGTYIRFKIKEFVCIPSSSIPNSMSIIDFLDARENDSVLSVVANELTTKSDNIHIHGVNPRVSQFIPEGAIDKTSWATSISSQLYDNGFLLIEDERVYITKPTAPVHIKLSAGISYIFIVNLYDVITYGSYLGLNLYVSATHILNLTSTIIGDAVFAYITYTPTNDLSGFLQILQTNSVGDENGNTISFKMDVCGFIPYTDELYNTCKNISASYSGGELSFINGFYNYNIDATLVTELESNFINLESSFDKKSMLFDATLRTSTELFTPYWNNWTYGTLVTDTQFTVSVPSTLTEINPNTGFYGAKILTDAYSKSGITIAVIVKGTVIATNLNNLLLQRAGLSSSILAQDLSDGVETSFEYVDYFTYDKDYSGNGQYIYLSLTSIKTIGEVATGTVNIEDFFIFEKQDNWSIDDYLANKDKVIYTPLYFPSNVVTEEILEDKLNNIEESTAVDQYSLSYSSDINMLITYGQSLSVGGGATDVNSDFKNILSFPGGCNEWSSDVDITDADSVSSFYGDNFVDLSSLSSKSFPPVAASAISWISALEQQNNYDIKDYQFVLSTPGYSGAAISSFVKDTIYYNRLLFSVVKGKSHSNSIGKTFNVPVLFWVQGEANASNTQSSYYTTLKQLFEDLNADIKAITGQINDVAFITYQMSSVYEQTIGDTYYGESGPSFAQLQLSQEIDNVYLGGAMYQFKYGDIWHPSDRAVVGLQSGIIAKMIINNEDPYPLFYPISHIVYNMSDFYILDITFDVPVKPMRFDISGDDWHNINGKQENYGFSLMNSSGDSVIMEDPVIKRGNILSIKCNTNPTGLSLNYALDGHYGGGNLCDSQNIIVNNKSIDYVVDNFCPTFKDYII